MLDDAPYIRAMMRDGTEERAETVGLCAECGGEIVEGDAYAWIEGKRYHKTCLDTMASEEILALCGYAVFE